MRNYVTYNIFSQQHIPHKYFFLRLSFITLLLLIHYSRLILISFCYSFRPWKRPQCHGVKYINDCKTSWYISWRISLFSLAYSTLVCVMHFSAVEPMQINPRWKQTIHHISLFFTFITYAYFGWKNYKNCLILHAWIY